MKRYCTYNGWKNSTRHRSLSLSKTKHPAKSTGEEPAAGENLSSARFATAGYAVVGMLVRPGAPQTCKSRRSPRATRRPSIGSLEVVERSESVLTTCALTEDSDAAQLAEPVEDKAPVEIDGRRASSRRELETVSRERGLRLLNTPSERSCGRAPRRPARVDGVHARRRDSPALSGAQVARETSAGRSGLLAPRLALLGLLLLCCKRQNRNCTYHAQCWRKPFDAVVLASPVGNGEPTKSTGEELRVDRRQVDGRDEMGRWARHCQYCRKSLRR